MTMQIREYTQDKLTKVIDCIGSEYSPRISSEAISSTGGHIIYISGGKHERQDVKSSSVVAYTVLGEEFAMGGKEFPASHEDYEFGQRLVCPTLALVEDCIEADVCDQVLENRCQTI